MKHKKGKCNKWKLKMNFKKIRQANMQNKDKE